MRMVVFGSLNIDKTYLLEDFVRPGQTISASRMEQFCGGKGFNQAIALRRAGNDVHFAGAVGQDGGMLLEALDRNGINRDHVKVTSGAKFALKFSKIGAGSNACLLLTRMTNSASLF